MTSIDTEFMYITRRKKRTEIKMAKGHTLVLNMFFSFWILKCVKRLA